ncbi:L7Ae/L30e/S12e/Gadd45 family ribosomal protein [Paenibacillus ferrarius]|uniref:L7Ae/L30e/S12e/Gadd45 family ribosomal protein n=1 Tax=Paenibacillus ferrarius TaxID=1469647 RepID=UPI003D2B0513
MNPKLLNQLGLAMRAGKLVTGDEGVLKAIRSGEAKLVVMSTDASANTRKKFQDKCQFYGVPLMETGTKFELGRSIGKEMRVTIGVTDVGFAQMLQKSQEIPAEVKHIDQ